MEKTRIILNKFVPTYPQTYTLKTIHTEKYEGWQWWRRGEVTNVVEYETYYLEFQIDGYMLNTFTTLMANILKRGFSIGFPVKSDSEPITIGRGEDGASSIFTLTYLSIDHERNTILIDVTHNR